jgi:hypothetical protein
MSKTGVKLKSMKVKSWRAAWRDFRHKLALQCASCGRIHSRSPWRLGSGAGGVRLQAAWYCRPECLEKALLALLGRARPGAGRELATPHRVPLGLLLLSRQQLTAVQLRTALELQRSSGQGKIGEWLKQLGFATEAQITAALARQWACPVLRMSPGGLIRRQFTAIPIMLLESFQMIPVEFAEATGTLLIAFSEGIDHTVLYAVEQMLGYRTEACFVCPSVLQKGLQALAQRHAARDVVFDRMQDASECARIIGSYSAKVGAEEVRLARCGSHIWIRLETLRAEAVNLVLRAPTEVTSGVAARLPAAFAPAM